MLIICLSETNLGPSEMLNKMMPTSTTSSSTAIILIIIRLLTVCWVLDQPAGAGGSLSKLQINTRDKRSNFTNFQIRSLFNTNKSFWMRYKRRKYSRLNGFCLIRNHFKQLSTYRYRLHNDQSVSSQSQYSSDSDSFNKRSSEEDPKVFTSGLKRSQAFHTAELLQQQVRLTTFDICVKDDEIFICCGWPWLRGGWKLCSQFSC